MSAKRKVLPTCIVRARGYCSLGMLFLETARHVVLVNNVREGADLGQLRAIRREHLNPEATVTVIPRRDIEAIEVLEQ